MTEYLNYAATILPTVELTSPTLHFPLTVSRYVSVPHDQASPVCLSAVTNTKLIPLNASMLCACAHHPRCPIFSRRQLHCRTRKNAKLHLSPTCAPQGPVKHG